MLQFSKKYIYLFYKEMIMVQYLNRYEASKVWGTFKVLVILLVHRDTKFRKILFLELGVEVANCEIGVKQTQTSVHCDSTNQF